MLPAPSKRVLVTEDESQLHGPKLSNEKKEGAEFARRSKSPQKGYLRTQSYNELEQSKEQPCSDSDGVGSSGKKGFSQQTTPKQEFGQMPEKGELEEGVTQDVKMVKAQQIIMNSTRDQFGQIVSNTLFGKKNEIELVNSPGFTFQDGREEMLKNYQTKMESMTRNYKVGKDRLKPQLSGELERVT